MAAATTATTVPAQVGAGRTVHEAAQGATSTMCDRPVSRVLTAEEAAKKGKACAQCAKITAYLAAEEAPEVPAVEEAAPEVDDAPAEQAHAEAAPEYRTLKGVGANGAFQMHGDLHEVRGKLVFTPWGTAKQIKGERHTFTRQWTERGGYRYLEDVQGRIVEFSGGVATKVWVVDGILAPAADVAEQAPADEPEAPEAPAVEETPEAADAPAKVAEPAEAEGTPEVDDAPAEPVQVTAYTAALEALHINGQDSDDRVLTLDASAVQETVAAMRRMPRWNAAQERFTVNKVAVIVARGAQGERVWVRGEAAPIRVDFTGNPIPEDAPAEAGTVDTAAVLAATRGLRRRAEVQRVIDNRTAARAASTPAPAEEPAA